MSRGPGAAFLLAQVGAHAATKFAERLAKLNLVPAHAGIFRIISATPAISQQALAAAVGTVPSRLVALIDELESQGLVERRPHETDRRSYALHLTEKGQSTLEFISRIAREHRQDLLVALSEEEQRELTVLLQRIAEQQGLIKGVHPGFAKIGRTRSRANWQKQVERNDQHHFRYSASRSASICDHRPLLPHAWVIFRCGRRHARGDDPRLERHGSIRWPCFSQNWLYRIATNVCLDEIHNKGRRARPMEEGSAFSGTPSVEDLVQRPANLWIEPISDARALPSDSDPSERAILKQSVRLAFVAALQKLAPKQRAALLLMDVLGFSAAEAAETLDTSVASVNSALQRARAALSDRNIDASPDLSEPQMEMLNRYVTAFEQYDIDALTKLLRQDATLSMPPYALWFQGPAAIRNWMLGLGCGCRGSQLAPVAACGSPAFAQYRPNPEGGHKAWALDLLSSQEIGSPRSTRF